MVGWHHRLNGHEFEQTLEDSEGQGSRRSAVHGVVKNWTQFSDNKNTNGSHSHHPPSHFAGSILFFGRREFFLFLPLSSLLQLSPFSLLASSFAIPLVFHTLLP